MCNRLYSRNLPQVGVAPSKLLFRLPATWAGVQAAKELEAQGLATHVSMVYRCVLLVMMVTD